MRLRAKAVVGLAAGLALVGVFVSSGTPDQTATAATASTAMPTGNVSSNGTTWVPVYSQNFNTNAAVGQFAKVYGDSWAGYKGFRDTSGKGYYNPIKVLSVKSGHLDYYVHTESGLPRVASVLPNGYKGQTYGRYAIRFRSDKVTGYKLAFLLWPASDNWADGEIDWPDGNLGGNIYPASKIVGSSTNAFDQPSHAVTYSMGTGWHTAVTEWTKGHVRWYLDGKFVGQTTNSAGVPTKPMRWTLQVETNTDGKAVPASAKGHVQVAWVVQYKQK